jgi:hypothetical protein
VVLWPFVFVMTDVVNEYYGPRGVRRLSFYSAGMITYAFVMLWLTQYVEAAPFSPIDDPSFARVFLQSRWIIVGSITAFLAHPARRRVGVLAGPPPHGRPVPVAARHGLDGRLPADRYVRGRFHRSLTCPPGSATAARACRSRSTTS